MLRARSTRRGPKRSETREKTPRHRKPETPRVITPTDDATDVLAVLRSVDRAPFEAYRRLIGRHRLGEFTVAVDHVPPDPFAGPARVRISIARSTAMLPADLADGLVARTALEDHLTREAVAVLERHRIAAENTPPGVGRIFVEPPGPAVLERTTCRVGDTELELRLWIDLPAAAGWVRGMQAVELFDGPLTRLAMATLVFSARRIESARGAVDAAVDHVWLQGELPRKGLAAFVADGSRLWRASPDAPAPRRGEGGVPFLAPDSRALSLDLPRGGTIRGLAIPAGVTVVIGGAFQGKSTLLSAIAAGVHPHPPGDGRERVAAVAGAVEVRAEARRPVLRADLSGFVRSLPSGARPADFSSQEVSGALAQAASLVEAVEAGATLLLLDEDHAAASFWVGDGRMGRLVPPADDPLIPLVDRLRELYSAFGVSAILATRGAGDFLEPAHTVLRMDGFRVHDVTRQAAELAEATRAIRPREALPALPPPARRQPRLAPSAAASASRVSLRGRREIRVGEEVLDLSALPQLVEPGQLRAIALLLRGSASVLKGQRDLREVLDDFEGILDAGIDRLDAAGAHDAARPRRFEIAAALNRWRALAVDRPDRRG